MVRNKSQGTTLFQDKNRDRYGSSLVNPSVVKTVNIIDPSKAIVVNPGVPPKSSHLAASKPQPTPVVPKQDPPKQVVQPVSLLRYHLVGETEWKTVFGFRADTSVQPIQIVKDSKFHSIVVSSPNETIQPCTIRIHYTTPTETTIVSVTIKQVITGSVTITPLDSNDNVEWDVNIPLLKGTNLSVRIDQNQDLDLELYIQ